MNLFKVLFISLLLATITSNYDRSFLFIINDKEVIMKEETLDNCFGSVFTKLVEAKYAKESNLELWSETYVKWKNLAFSSVYSWKLYGSRVGELSNSRGHTTGYEMRGLDKNGNTITSGNPNNPKNIGRRIALLNGLMTQEISNMLSKK